MAQSITPNSRSNNAQSRAIEEEKKKAQAAASAEAKPAAAAETKAAAPTAKPASGKSETAAAPKQDTFVGAATPQAQPKRSAEEDAMLARNQRRSVRAEAAAAAPSERVMTFEYDTAGRKDVSDVKLKGSWNKQSGDYDASWGGGDSVQMRDDGQQGDRVAGDGVYTAQQKIKDDGSGKRFEWGVTLDNKAGNDQWAIMKEGNLSFQATDGDRQAYAPTTGHKMGIQKQGTDGASFRVWMPNLPQGSKVSVDLTNADGTAATFKDPATGKTKNIELTRDEKTGMWSAELPTGWKNLEGKFYQYKIQRPDISEPLVVKDPYSRYQQGQQRGVERVALDNATGTERAWYWDAKNPGKEWGQFRYKPPAGADAATLQLKDKEGKVMDRAALEKLMGQTPADVAAQMPLNWKDQVAADGTITLKQKNGAFETNLFNFRGIQGIGYELNATKAGQPLETRKGALGDDLVQNREEVKLGYKDGANPKSDWARFEVNEHPDATRATLVLKDASGKQLTRDKILALVGEADPKMRQQLGNVWQDSVKADGTIDLTKKEGVFRTMLPNFDSLVGLRHELKVYKQENGKTVLVGDANKDGKLSAAERKTTAYNDPNARILEDPSGSRGGEIRTDAFDFKHANAPRMETNQNKFITYEAHVGTFFSQNGATKRSTFEDMIGQLDYLKKLGVNTIELMPTSEFAGSREWGYTIVDYFSGESGYGFEDKNGKWVTGTEAIKMFNDAAHEKGFNVLGDVVYNHVGDRDNTLWRQGGPENPFFEWGKDGKSDIRNTPWGALPAYNNEAVKQYFTDHAVAQVQDLGFDGLRFDFTSVMHTTGGQEGWEMLRQINKTLRFVKPDVYTTAEEFPNDPGMADPIRPNLQGAGFDTQWNDPFHDRLLENVQKAAKGQKGDMDGLLDALVHHPGRSEGKDGVTYIHSHDEVGNTNDWVSKAADNYDGRAVPSAWAADQARNTAGLALLSTGTPMIWQGEEFLSNREFRHGKPDTWGNDWQWQNRPTAPEQVAAYNRMVTLSPDQLKNDAQFKGLKTEEKAFFEKYKSMTAEEKAEVDYDAKRWGTFRFYQDAISLRKSSAAFDADAEVKSVYSHNDNAIAAFTRKKGNEEYLVITSFNKNDFQNYGLDLPGGRWQEVMNSDAARFNGDNFGNGGGTFNGGRANLNIPGGGLIVLKRVG